MTILVGFFGWSCCSQIGFLRGKTLPKFQRFTGDSKILCCGDDGSSTSTHSAHPRISNLEGLRAQLVPSITTVDRVQWDACHDGSNPFVSYNFLHAIEASGSATPRTGWLPQHLVLTADCAGDPDTPSAQQRKDREQQAPPPQGTVLGCVPLYLKSHSYGEYVFDSAWAEAYDSSMASSRPRRHYYPKLQSCVPFTPVSGPRILLRPGPDNGNVASMMAQTLRSLPEELGVSGIHVTFNTADERRLLEATGFLSRCGVQYWWHNDASTSDGYDSRYGSLGASGTCIGDPNARMYESFDGFLSTLQQKKRKAIRQERKKVAAEGLRIRRLTGEDLRDASLWDSFYAFYCNTVDRKWGVPYLTRDFFAMVAETMSQEILLVVADGDKFGARPVAAALNFIGGHDALYGRNWGCVEGCGIKGLHFELCFYQAIEHAIEARLRRVEAGAQGEHKVARGYLPSLTYSSHYMVEPGFNEAVRSFLRREAIDMAAYVEALTAEGSPFKKLKDRL